MAENLITTAFIKIIKENIKNYLKHTNITFEGVTALERKV